ncbi:hypothetical protein ABFZ85_10195 [Hyphococcus formosus]|uniref:hypothetical protein n=1 Tax=Hyphococcus formosus TaxID=3143534 RepID=UPI00398ACD47
MRQFGILTIFAGLSLITGCSTATEKSPEITSTSKPKIETGPVYQLDQLLGTNGQNIDALLGTPALTRREGEGEFRRYALKECTVIVILYPDELGIPTVEHVDVTALESGSEKPDLVDCLAAG